MFATLLTGLPNPDPSGDLDTAIESVIRAQEAAGLEPITDGRLRAPGADLVAAWQFAAARTERAVKQTIPGPYSAGWASEGDGMHPGAASGSTHRTRILEAADAARTQIEALVAAGCPLIEIEERDAHRIGEDSAAQALFREAHARMTSGIVGTHLSLSIVGQAADSAGVETILAAPYASLALDLIEGPDNWNLVTRTAGERGIVVGAMGAGETRDEPREILLWAAHYAASTMGRGRARVGLGSAGDWTKLTWAAAVRKMHALGAAAALAAQPPGQELLDSVDPQAVSARRAALGSGAPRAPKRRRTL